jgi:hypothetical protein
MHTDDTRHAPARSARESAPRGSSDFREWGVERRRRVPGAFCPMCDEFVDQRWAVIDENRLVFLCWSGHRWVDRRRPHSTDVSAIDLRDDADRTSEN